MAIHAARRALAPHGTVNARGEALSLEAAELWVDVAAFEVAAATARQSHDPADYARALDLYGGELLPEDRYEDWASIERDRLRGHYLALLLDVATLHEGSGDWPPAIAALQRVLGLEPAHESAHIGLMRLYALAGQRARALRSGTDSSPPSAATSTRRPTPPAWPCATRSPPAASRRRRGWPGGS